MEEFFLPDEVACDSSYLIVQVLANLQNDDLIREVISSLDLNKDFTQEDLESL